MPDQTITATSAPVAGGGQFTISVSVRDGKLSGLSATDSEGREYSVSLQLNAKDSQQRAVKPLNICCCVDEVGNIHCQDVDGPCPQCP